MNPNSVPIGQDDVADGLHKMCLAEAYAAVDEERVVRPRRVFGDGLTSCERHPAVVPHHELFEEELGIERLPAVPVLAFRGEKLKVFEPAGQVVIRSPVRVCEANERLSADEIPHHVAHLVLVVFSTQSMKNLLGQFDRDRVVLDRDEPHGLEPGLEGLLGDHRGDPGQEVRPHLVMVPI